MEVAWSHVAVAVAAVAWALAAAAARARPRGMATKEWLQGLVIAHFPAFYHKHILPAVYGDLTASINVGQPDLRDLLPTLEAAPSLGAASFGPGDVVDPSPDAAGSRKIVATSLLPRMLEALADYETGATGKMYAAVDALVEACLPHVGACPDGTRPTLDRCVYYCMNKERGAYFPVIHWDTDWVQFPAPRASSSGSARAAVAGVGNMFVVSTPDLRPDDPSVRYVPTKGGGLAKIFHDPGPRAPAQARVAAAPSLDAQLRELWAVRDGFFASDPAAKAALVARRVSSLVAAAEACDASSAEARARFAAGRPADGAFDRSVALAKDALRCDLGDGESWYVLGNAHVARFFSRGAGGRDPRDLRFAAKAYASAEAKYDKTWKDPPDVGGIRGTFGNPDLFFNRGHLRRYVEDYAGACADRKRATSTARSRPRTRSTTRSAGCGASRIWCGARARSSRSGATSSTPRSIAGLKAPAGYRERTLADLVKAPLGASDADAAAHFRSAANARTFVVLVVALELRRDGAVPPDAYLAFGRGNAATPCVALSVYDGDTAKLAPGAVVVVLDPVVVDVPRAATGDFVGVERGGGRGAVAGGGAASP
ncbi:hypothetical protein JL720_8965 [Aureococcus anophagefferens]|nr:hypothetical protein JL720_8965 [Aureococcus anophagefferens]